VALIIRILLFLASLVFTIVLLIGATTGFAKENKTIEFSGETVSNNFRMYDVKWIHEKDSENKTVVCGTELKTFDYSGRKFIFAYYLLLLDDGKIVSRFNVDALQISFENQEPLKTEDLFIKVYGAKMSKDGKDRLGGMRSPQSEYKSFDAQFNEFKSRDIEDIKIFYKGEYDLYVRIMPMADIQIPVIKNPKYTLEQEKYIDECVDELIKNKEYRNKPKGEVFAEQVQNVG
jgi:hypothetical protein